MIKNGYPHPSPTDSEVSPIAKRQAAPATRERETQMQQDSDTPHHPLIRSLPHVETPPTDGFFTDFLGVRTRISFVEEFLRNNVQARQRWELNQTTIPIDEMYFEWIDLLEAIQAARRKFVMFELGAGYGRWVVRAAALIRLMHAMPFRLVAAEAEPTHFRWMQQHFLDNGLNPGDHDLVEGAVNGKGGRVVFAIGQPSAWYGQSIVAGPEAEPHAPSIIRRVLQGLVRRPSPNTSQPVTSRVRGVMLEELLNNHDQVDLVDLDVQGVELEILSAAIGPLDKKVKRVHIGTHSAEIEAGLRQLFIKHSWHSLNDYPALTSSRTPYGMIEFQDGVQTWLNPRLFE